MVRYNHTRRKFLEVTGAGLIGFSGIASAKQDEISGNNTTENSISVLEISDTPQKLVDMAVDGNNVVNTGFTVGYYGSQPYETWVDGETKSRWNHLFESTMFGKAESGYNIEKQSFKAEYFGGAEHNGSPNAAAASWPDPPFDNFTPVAKKVIKSCLTAASTVASVVLTDADIMEAYGKKNFGTNSSSNISFTGDYTYSLRAKVSNSVHFEVDTVPGNSGIVDITSSATDVGTGENVGATISATMQDDAYYFEQNALQESSVTLRDTLDAMSERQLAKHNIHRINPSEVSAEVARNSRFDLSKDRPSYIKFFDPQFEFAAENGSVVNPSIAKK